MKDTGEQTLLNTPVEVCHPVLRSTALPAVGLTTGLSSDRARFGTRGNRTWANAVELGAETSLEAESQSSILAVSRCSLSAELPRSIFRGIRGIRATAKNRGGG